MVKLFIGILDTLLDRIKLIETKNKSQKDLKREVILTLIDLDRSEQLRIIKGFKLKSKEFKAKVKGRMKEIRAIKIKRSKDVNEHSRKENQPGNVGPYSDNNADLKEPTQVN